MDKHLRPETWLVIVMAVGVGGFAGVKLADPRSATASTSAATVHNCSVTDGDTVRCDGERIRLLGIDAPELPGHCREGRVCVPGDPYASTASLGDALQGVMTIKRVGTDHYGRTLAMLAGDKGDLSCWQISHRQAVYKAIWDNGLRVARTCPRAVWSG